MSAEIQVRNPRSGDVDYSFTAPGREALSSSIQSLRSNQQSWQALGINARVEVLKRWQTALIHEKDAIVSALALDTGRQLLAEQEFAGLLGSISRWCEQAPTLLTDYCQPATAMPNVDIHGISSPYPVLGAISPWNFPLLLSFIDVTPALLAGCAAIIKPSEVTPRFAEPVAQSIAAVPELAAVLSIAPGDGSTGQEMIKQVDVVAFTGSVATGRKVAVAAAESFIPAFLELGGKDPVIVLDGSDIDRATTSILRASIAATGQACQSLERIYVCASQYGEFSAMLAKKASQVELSKGDSPQQIKPNGNVGPLIFARQAEIIADHLQDAKDKGARILTGGTVEDDQGAFWVKPTVLTDVDHSMKIMTEETFGPLMPIMSFETTEEAIKLANDSIYGLSAAVFGPDEETALTAARQINAGGISVNDSGMTTMLFETEKSAFGFSGMGPSRIGRSGLTRFLRQKSLYVNHNDTVIPISIFNEGTSS